MKQWEMGRSQTPLPPERRASVLGTPYRHPAAPRLGMERDANRDVV